MTIWTDFVKEHRNKHPSKSYKQALIDCKPLYQKGRGLDQEVAGLIKSYKDLKNKKPAMTNRLESSIGKLRSQLGVGIIDSIANAVLSTKENKMEKGERHQMIKLPDGRIAPAAYSGPMTALETRIRRGDKPLSFVDETAQAHDLRYQLAKTEADVKLADKKMIDSLEKAKKEGLDNMFNIRQAELIKAKYLLQDKFGMPTSWFTSFGLDSIKDKSLIPVMEAKLKELEQKGLGRKVVKKHKIKIAKKIKK